MISLVLLVCVVGAAVAQSSSSSASDTSGLLERLNEGKKLIFDLDSANPVTSEDDDDDDTFTSEASSSSLEALERALRQEKKDARAARKEAGAAIAALERGARNPIANQAFRESYQAVMTCTECATANVALGPVVFIAKNTAGAVQDDHFDQNPAGPDGFDDVDFALNRWQETTAVATRALRIEDFLIQVRNRATVNGGSIGLQALILTGKQKLANGLDSTTDATFGGTAQRLLISPCMPVINDIPLFTDPTTIDGSNGGYNIQVFGSVVNQPALFEIDNTDARVPLSAFFDFNENEFRDETASFGFKVYVDDDDNELDNAVTGLENQFGAIKFEKCTRFSYFN